MKTKYIKSFEFDTAQYIVSDGKVSFRLKVFYKDNYFHLEPIAKEIPAYLSAEISDIAKDLLERKHGRNFAELEVAK